jgi:tetratricopeptide (TPR) repeat protein
VENIRSKAKTLRQAKDYPAAIEIYKQLWDSNDPQKNDKWLGWEYADSLKKNGQLDEAIRISHQVYAHNQDFKYNNDLHSWCLYEKYFKSLKDQYTIGEEKELLDKADLVIKLVGQNNATPYEHVVFQILKMLKNKTNYSASIILYWLSKINILMISDESYEYTDKSGKKLEIQSRKEAFYSYKTKALFEGKQYVDCIKCCDEALSQIKKFHHDNDIWIKVRKAKSIALTGDLPIAINSLIELQIQKDHWSILMDISLLYFNTGDLTNSLIYALRAALTKDPEQMKINVYDHIGQILEKTGDPINALLHYMFEKKIREDNDWGIPFGLSARIEKLCKSDTKAIPLFSTLKEFWVNGLKALMGTHTGVINNVIGKGQIGFITCENDSIFFKSDSVINNKKIRQGNKASFCIIDSYDRKKKQKTKEAAYIEVI